MAEVGYDIEIRRAMPVDSVKVWRWRNNPLVRNVPFPTI